MNEKKYKLTDECITICGSKLYRIEALKDFANIIKGQKGGFVESEENLSQEGNCWVYDNAKIYDNAIVGNDAKVYGNAKIYDNAIVGNDAKVYGNAEINDNAMVFGNAKVCDNVEICGDAYVSDHVEICGDAKIESLSDYIIFKNWWSSGRYFIWTKSNNMWSVGCFSGTAKELVTKAYKDSKLKGREYERVVKYVESIIKDNEL